MKGTWVGLMSPLRCLAQTEFGVLYRHCTGVFPREYFGVVSKYYWWALAKHNIGVLEMQLDIDIDFYSGTMVGVSKLSKDTIPVVWSSTIWVFYRNIGCLVC